MNFKGVLIVSCLMISSILAHEPVPKRDIELEARMIGELRERIFAEERAKGFPHAKEAIAAGSRVPVIEERVPEVTGPSRRFRVIRRPATALTTTVEGAPIVPITRPEVARAATGKVRVIRLKR